MIEKGLADEKVSDGWLRIGLIFEVIAVTEDVTKKSMVELANRLMRDKRIEVYGSEMSNTMKIDNPTKDVKVGYTANCEINAIIKNFENLVEIVMEYGPSSIEIIEPKRMTVQMNEAQAVINKIASMMHGFASSGLGGIIFVREKPQTV